MLIPISAVSFFLQRLFFGGLGLEGAGLGLGPETTGLGLDYKTGSISLC